MRRPRTVLLAAAILATTLLACDGGDDDGELGDPCRDNDDCESALYCETPVGECDSAGTCHVRPGGCPDNVEPVCGCDGATYSNSCDAAAIGMSLESDGACP